MRFSPDHFPEETAAFEPLASARPKLPPIEAGSERALARNARSRRVERLFSRAGAAPWIQITALTPPAPEGVAYGHSQVMDVRHHLAEHLDQEGRAAAD